MDLKIFRKQGIVEFKLWKGKNRAVLEMANILPNAPKGQPKPGDKIYDYDNKITLQFKSEEMLQWSCNFLRYAMGDGTTEKYSKFGDTSKVADHEGGEVKQFTMTLTDKGGINLCLSIKDKTRVNITIDPADAYAISKWLEIAYNGYFLISLMKEDEPKP